MGTGRKNFDDSWATFQPLHDVGFCRRFESIASLCDPIGMQMNNTTTNWRAEMCGVIEDMQGTITWPVGHIPSSQRCYVLKAIWIHRIPSRSNRHANEQHDNQLMGTNAWGEGGTGRDSSHNPSSPIHAMAQLPLRTLVGLPLRHRDGFNNKEQY